MPAGPALGRVAVDEATCARAARALEDRCGLSFHGGNRDVLEHGLGRAALEAALAPDELAARLAGPGDADLQLVLPHVTIAETYFFRHPEHFDFLRERVLPELLLGRTLGRSLRAWSAGCATGEEAYSLAMVLADATGGAGDVGVLGTDVNKAALETARAARYGRWSVRGGHPLLAHDRYAARQPDGGIAIAPALRRLVHFRHLNLHEACYPSPLNGTEGFDLVFCRNVLVYLTADAARAVLERLAQSLVEGGYLVLSALDCIEPPRGLEVVRHDRGVALRRNTLYRPSLPSTAFARPRPAAPPPVENAPSRPSAAAPACPSPRPAMAVAKAAADEGDRERAAHLAAAALAEERSPEAMHLLALVVGERGDRAEMERLLCEAVELWPAYVLGHLDLGLGVCGRAPGDGGRAERHLARVLDLIERRPDDELLPGPDPLPVSWVRRMARVGLEHLERGGRKTTEGDR
jgi:chemotaxis protein methyltransferase CheR